LNVDSNGHKKNTKNTKKRFKQQKNTAQKKHVFIHPYIKQYEVGTGTLAVDGWAVFGTARRPSPLLAVPNVTAHPSTASVPITVLLYNGPLLCDFSVPVKGLRKFEM